MLNHFFLQIATSLLDSLAQCPVENMASAIVPMELVGLAGTKVKPPGDGEVADGDEDDGEVGDGGGDIDDDDDEEDEETWEEVTAPPIVGDIDEEEINNDVEEESFGDIDDEEEGDMGRGDRPSHSW